MPAFVSSTPPRRHSRVPVRALGVLWASCLAVPLTAGSASAGVPHPTPERTLPKALDVITPYQRGTLCLTKTQPGVAEFAKLLNDTYGSHVYGTLRTCALEHGEGRALDWMLDASKPDQLALGNELTRWLTAADSEGRPGAMARRFGINYIIWNRQQWNAWTPEMAWKAYYGASPHTDHIHFSFNWDGALKNTSWWSGRAVVEPATGPDDSTPSLVTPDALEGYIGTTLRRGSSGRAVTMAQAALGELTVDGVFGPAMEARVEEYQKRKNLTVDGVIGAPVWRALVVDALRVAMDRYASRGTTLRLGSSGEAVRILQRGLGKLAIDGSFGPLTEARVREYQKSKGLPSTGVADTAVWNVLLGRSATGVYDLSAYRDTTLRRGSTGDAVKALQQALGGLAVDGSFGALTESRVEDFQKSKGLTVNGVVGAAVWDALIGKPAPPVPTQTVSPLARYVDVRLRLWSRGDAVKALQKALGGLTADGVFGPLTEGRVKAYEKKKGMAQDGVVDTRFWKALIADGGSAPAGSSTSTASGSSADLTTEYTALKSRTLKRGLGGLTVDGVFGSRTEARVKTLQGNRGMPRTGVVDRATWTAVELRAHPTLPYWTKVLRRGSSGTAVKALQREIGGLTVDGRFGPLTEAAVKRVQKGARLAQTGVVGTVTWRAVDKS